MSKFIENGKWQFPLAQMIRGERKVTPIAVLKLIFVATMIKVVVVNTILLLFFPEHFPAPLTDWVVTSIADSVMPWFSGMETWLF